MNTKTGSLCFVSAVVLCFCLCLPPVTNAREVNQQAIYGSPSEEDVFWKRLTDLLYNDEQPEAGQLETQGGESTMEGSDDVPLSANYRLVAPFKRGRHLNNCVRFKTFGHGYSGLC